MVNAMKMEWLWLTVALLAGCNSHSSPKEPDARRTELKAGEKMATFPLEPYQWRKDPDCYVSKGAFDPLQVQAPQSRALKWQKPRRFLGYIYATFEGSTFVDAKRSENPKELGEGRYYALIYYDDSRINFGPPAKIYWVDFIGREAVCNSQRLGDANNDKPSSPNLVISDHFEALTPIH